MYTRIYTQIMFLLGMCLQDFLEDYALNFKVSNFKVSESNKKLKYSLFSFSLEL